MSKRDKAIKWWNGLSDSSKRFYDWMTFSHEEWEDQVVYADLRLPDESSQPFGASQAPSTISRKFTHG